MAGKIGNPILKQDIEKMAGYLDGHKCILFGGASLPFYGVERATVDVDLEIPDANQKLIDLVDSRLEKARIQSDVTSNASGWGMIPLPEGYRERSIETEIENISVLNPLDFILSKMRRGTEIDFEDCLAVCKAQVISGEEIKHHMEHVKLPADTESGLFIRKVKVLSERVGLSKKKLKNKRTSDYD